MNLVVSLISLVYDDKFFQDGIDFNASDPKKYRILVRGPNGKLLAVNERAREEFVVEEKNRAHACNVGAGYGNGAVIPLAKWYDMTVPGEYTVLAAIHFTRNTNLVCVSNRVTIKVAKPDPGKIRLFPTRSRPPETGNSRRPRGQLRPQGL